MVLVLAPALVLMLVLVLVLDEEGGVVVVDEGRLCWCWMRCSDGWFWRRVDGAGAGGGFI